MILITNRGSMLQIMQVQVQPGYGINYPSVLSWWRLWPRAVQTESTFHCPYFIFYSCLTILNFHSLIMCFWGALTWWLSGFVINVSLQSSSSLSPIAQSLALRIQSFVLRVLAVANEYGTNLHSVETAEDVAFLRPFQQKTNAVSHLRDLSFGRILTVTLGVILHKVYNLSSLRNVKSAPMIGTW